MSSINATTQVCAVFGHPIRHSLSPAIHNAGFEALALPFVYVAHDVLPEQLGAAFQGVRAMGYRGLSVTIPHKVAAIELVDEVEPVARAIGCINTVVNDGGVLRGFNSDGRGALGALRAAGSDPAGKRVVVLGSGGAARAIAMTLAMEARPAHIHILGVIEKELERLVNDVGQQGATVTGALLADRSVAAAVSQADLLLNCSPVGMHPKIDESPIPTSQLAPGLVVFDAVYNPRRTRLLTDAAARGCRTVPGLEMFLGQALIQFELWTGRQAPASIMRSVLEANL